MNITELANLVIERAASSTRYIVAVAGPPASGKSTIASSLCKTIAKASAEANPIVVPMDGFHLDNKILDKLNLRHRKGAAETFDANAFVETIQSIYAEDTSVNIPEFNRELDKVVNHGKIVTKANQIVIVEGNYLFLDEVPWKRLLDFFDMPVFILPKTETLEKRLIERWANLGYSFEGAKKKAYSNDIPNAKFILANSAYIDLTFEEVLL